MIAAARALLLATVLLGAGCQWWNDDDPDPGPLPRRVELHQSAPQQLVLRNETNAPLTIVAAASGAPDRTVAPGESFTIVFEIASFADIRPAGSGGEEQVPGSETNMLEASRPANYLRQADLDLEVNLRGADGTVTPVRFDLQDCAPDWSDAPALAGEHFVEYPSPLVGVPQPICPPPAP